MERYIAKEKNEEKSKFIIYVMFFIIFLNVSNFLINYYFCIYLLKYILTLGKSNPFHYIP